MALVRVSTGEDWNGLMHVLSQKPEDCLKHPAFYEVTNGI